LFVAFLVLYPTVLFLPYAAVHILTSPEEVYLGPEFWPKHGEQQDFFTHKYVHIDKTLRGNPTNVTFHYIEAGDPSKEKIVFTMGASEPALIYSELMKHFMNDYHVISIDGKGFPYSSVPSCNKIDKDTTDLGSNWDPSFQGEEMVTALDAIGVKKFNLVSSDLMSIVTSFWVGEWQDRVIRYVRAQSHIGIQTYSSVPQGMFFKNFPRVAVGLLSRVRVLIWRLITGQTGVSLFDAERRTGANFTMPPELNEKVIRVLRSGSVVPWVYFWLSLPRPTLWVQIHKFREITSPVLLLQGIEDKAQPYWFYDGSVRLDFPESVPEGVEEIRPKYLHAQSEEQQKQWRAESYFPNSSYCELVWFEGVGHFPHFEAPQEYAQHVERFFRLTKHLVKKD